VRLIVFLMALLCAACASSPPATPDPTRLLDEGRAHLALYEWDRAIAAFDEAATVAPGVADTHCLRGLAYASSPGGRAARDAALRDYIRCLELAPNGLLAENARAALAVLQAAETVAPP
jgi:Flp pilus assembly protein TadD